MSGLIAIFTIAVVIWAVNSTHLLSLVKKELKIKEKEFQDHLENEKLVQIQIRSQEKEIAQKELNDKLLILSQKFSEDNAHLISQALSSNRVLELKDELNKILEQQFSKMSQEFIGHLVDESDSVKTHLILDIGDQIWNQLQQVKEKFKDSPYVLPQDCKLAYTRGNRTVVVIEQKPQKRSVTFNHELVSNKVAAQAQGQTLNGYRFTLAFPHILFFIVFDKGKYAYHEIYFRNKPLLSIREYVYLAPIPNIFRDRGKDFKPMCMGIEFSVDKGDTLARQCEYAVSMFWQSTFNDHLGDGGGRKIDKRIKNWAEWQKNSLNDPLFILNIQWKQGRTAKGVIESILELRDHKHESDATESELKNHIDAGLDKIATSVKEAVKIAKLHKLNKGDLEDSVKQKFESILIKHTDAVFNACIEKGK